MGKYVIDDVFVANCKKKKINSHLYLLVSFNFNHWRTCVEVGKISSCHWGNPEQKKKKKLFCMSKFELKAKGHNNHLYKVHYSTESMYPLLPPQGFEWPCSVLLNTDYSKKIRWSLCQNVERLQGFKYKIAIGCKRFILGCYRI